MAAWLRSTPASTRGRNILRLNLTGAVILAVPHEGYDRNRSRLGVRPAVERLTQTGVVFVDASTDAFDVIVTATGYQTALGSVLALPDAIATEGRRFRSGRSTPFPGLYFIGYDETTRGVLYESNRDSRKLAALVS